MSFRLRTWLAPLGAALTLGACSDAPSAPDVVPLSSSAAVKFWEAGSAVAWNRTARDILASRTTSPIVEGRVLAYLAVAQYNAVNSAHDSVDEGLRPSPAAAIAGASVVVLKNFFPFDHALIDARFAAQQSAAPLPMEQLTDFAAGDAIGRAIGAAVNAYAASDNFNQAVPAPNPGGPGNWTGVNSIRGLYGTRPFALTSGDQFRPAPPPAFGSPEYNAALAEIRTISDGLTSGELAIAQFWHPRGPSYFNSLAAERIISHHRSEREAARVFALVHMAMFDVLTACFDAKFAYWYIRPSQADPLINLPVGLPNHPSYPSGHSCLTGAMATVLANAFPEESADFQVMAEEAGLARMYAGLHYRFDCEVGRDLGKKVAEHVMRTTAGGHALIPLD
jgi:membrane-associated phospholipid phosphatase